MSSGCKAGLAHVEPHASSHSVRAIDKPDTYSVHSRRSCLPTTHLIKLLVVAQNLVRCSKAYGTGAADEYLVALLSPAHLLAPSRPLDLDYDLGFRLRTH